MELKRRTSLRGVFAIWIAGIILGAGAGAIAASMLRALTPEPPPVAPLAAASR